MLAPTLMIQGTASSVGKSLLVAGLCRLFRRYGVDVAPFKAQNMSLNAAVTPDGFEIGRAQAVQAEAAGLAPSVEMNPILLKPEGPARAQVVLRGKPRFTLSAAEYHERKPELRQLVCAALETLRSRHQLVIIEGAGSPAEINLRDRDLVNMYVAHAADAPVLLVGDIDRGGVFAALVGTLELLEPPDRARVAGLVINKFRGDLGLLEPGLEFLRQRAGLPVLGVVPWLERLRVADEDSLSLEPRTFGGRAGAGTLDIAVVRLPHISNFDDVSALEHEPGVQVRFATSARELSGADLVILPGTKTTIADLEWLRATSIAEAVLERAQSGGLVLGICGGCQMLGRALEDPEGIESRTPVAEGLGLLPLRTRFRREKTTASVRAISRAPSFLCEAGRELEGYEIHMGEVVAEPGAARPFEILSRNGSPDAAFDGAIDAAGNVVGTLLHGLFENTEVREHLIEELRKRRGLPGRTADSALPSRSAEYDRLANALEASLDVAALRRLAGIIAPHSA